MKPFYPSGRYRVQLSAGWKLILSEATIEGLFFVPVLTAYYGSKGVSLAGFFALEVIYRTGFLLCNVPAGILSDRTDRRFMIRVSSLIWIFCIGAFILADGFYGLAVAVLFTGIADSLKSGSIRAYLHEHSVLSTISGSVWQSRLVVACLISQTVCSSVGGWLYEIRNEAPMIATMAMGIIGCALAFTLPAPAVSYKKIPVVKINQSAISELNRSERAQRLLLLSAPSVLFAVTGSIFWLGQVHMRNIGASSSSMGLLMAGYFVIKALVSHYAGRIRGNLSEIMFIAIGFIIQITATVGLAFSDNILLAWFFMFMGAGFTHGAGQPVITHLLCEHAREQERATLLSAASTVQVFSGMILNILFALVINDIGTKGGIMIQTAVAVTGLAVCVLTAIFLKRHNL